MWNKCEYIVKFGVFSTVLMKIRIQRSSLRTICENLLFI